MNGWLVALLITALILGILLLLRLGLRVEFAAEKTRFFLCVGCVRVPIHTGKKTKQQKEKNEKKRVENLSGEKKNAGKKKKPALRDMLDLIGEMGWRCHSSDKADLYQGTERADNGLGHRMQLLQRLHMDVSGLWSALYTLYLNVW